jgi:hypothetical protein
MAKLISAHKIQKSSQNSESKTNLNINRISVESDHQIDTIAHLKI